MIVDLFRWNADIPPFEEERGTGRRSYTRSSSTRRAARAPAASPLSGDGAVDVAHGLGEHVSADPLAEVVAVLVAVLEVDAAKAP